jgi:two-component system, chemotaxis family, sensor kinase CheA
MDLRRFLDLYIAEAQDHLKLLHRSLLSLERDRTGAALDEAFRAAHTLKGISAAMGYDAVAGAAHQLEDRLAGLRTGAPAALAPAVDELLRQADALALAVDAATAQPPAAPYEDHDGVTAAPSRPSAQSAPAAPHLPAMVPAGTATVAAVRLQPDAPIKAARALLIMQGLGRQRGLIGSDPTTFTEQFDGSLSIFFGADADLRSAEAAIRAAGDVDTVDFQPVAPGTAAADPLAGAAKANAIRHVRVEAALLDDLADGIGELSTMVDGMQPAEGSVAVHDGTLDRVRVLLGTLQHDVLQLRMVPLREAFERLPRVVRDAARAVDRDVVLTLSGEDVQLDRAIVDELAEPLVHLLRNAVDHGIEDSEARVAAGKKRSGRIEVSARRERSSVGIVVADDGAGVAADRVLAKAREAGLTVPDSAAGLASDQLLALLSHPGLSTAGRVSTVSGRGVGMDVVVSRIRALGGAIDMQTSRGEGTTFSIRLPITLALAPALRVRVGDEQYFIPLTHVAEAVDLKGAIEADDTVRVRGERVPLVRLGRILDAQGGTSEDTAIIAGVGERRVALGIDELVGREQVLVKRFDAVTGLLPHFTGAAFLAGGRPALVLDPLSLIGGH